MNKWSLGFTAGLLLGACPWACPADFKFGSQTLTVPDGFTVELIAGPPLVDRPIVADFDEQGRLYVADSSGSNDKVEKQLAEKPHRILRLEDTDGDGRFDRQTVFADRMMFPEGVLFYDGAIYSSAPPSIWKLIDTDHDGVADQRSEWFQGKTLTGCANDLHGPYLGPDGWIYWAKGAFAKQTHERPGLPTIADSAAHVFRSRPDGSHFDSVMSGGMDNPVDVAFTAEGDPIFTTTFYVNPEGGKRDALVHAVYGGVYPKVHGVLDGLKRTGDLMPALTHLGPAAPCGLTRYASKSFGAGYEGNLFSCQFNLHKVQSHRLERAGATFRTIDSDFLVSDHPDFHPTDVLEDADGSLIVIDTGGWYKLCCPTSVIARPEVLGGIYRIRKVGAPAVLDPRGRKLKWETLSAQALTGLLTDGRPAVCERAIQQLAKRGAEAVSVLQEASRAGQPVVQRRNAVWALIRVDHPLARAAVRQALSDEAITVRQVAAHGAGIWRDRAAQDALISLLKTTDLHLRRQVATALGQIGDASAVPALLAAAGGAQDRFLDHALTYALIEIADAPRTRQGLTAADTQVQRVALIALDQMNDTALESRDVAPLLQASDPLLRSAALWIVGHRPNWAPDFASFYNDQLNRADLGIGERNDLRSQLTELARNESIQSLVGRCLGDEATPLNNRLLLLDVVSKAPLKTPPASWTTSLSSALTSHNDELSRHAVGAARSMSGPKKELVPLLMSVAEDTTRSQEARLEALAALPSGLDHPAQPLFELLLSCLQPARPILERSLAATVLSKATLDTEQLVALTKVMRTAGALELSSLLGAFEKAKEERVGLELVAALEVAPSLTRLRPDLVRARLGQFPPAVQERGNDLLRRMNLDVAGQKARLDKLDQGAQRGDSRHGQMIFNSAKAACATCHAVGYVGGRIGPDLTKVGPTRTERDLLESIIFPSATFVRSYEPFVVTTRDGEEHSGVLRNETERSVLLVNAPGVEQRIDRSDIVEMRPGTVSIMPEGLDEQLSAQELADLVSFLKSLR